MASMEFGGSPLPKLRKRKIAPLTDATPSQNPLTGEAEEPPIRRRSFLRHGYDPELFLKALEEDDRIEEMKAAAGLPHKQSVMKLLQENFALLDEVDAANRARAAQDLHAQALHPMPPEDPFRAMGPEAPAMDPVRDPRAEPSRNSGALPGFHAEPPRKANSPDPFALTPPDWGDQMPNPALDPRSASLPNAAYGWAHQGQESVYGRGPAASPLLHNASYAPQDAGPTALHGGSGLDEMRGSAGADRTETTGEAIPPMHPRAMVRYKQLENRRNAALEEARQYQIEMTSCFPRVTPPPLSEESVINRVPPQPSGPVRSAPQTMTQEEWDANALLPPGQRDPRTVYGRPLSPEGPPEMTRREIIERAIAAERNAPVPENIPLEPVYPVETILGAGVSSKVARSAIPFVTDLVRRGQQSNQQLSVSRGQGDETVTIDPRILEETLRNLPSNLSGDELRILKNLLGIHGEDQHGQSDAASIERSTYRFPTETEETTNEELFRGPDVENWRDIDGEPGLPKIISGDRGNNLNRHLSNSELLGILDDLNITYESVQSDDQRLIDHKGHRLNGRMLPDEETGRPKSILVNIDLPEEEFFSTFRHEVGHVLNEMIRDEVDKIIASQISDTDKKNLGFELSQIYHYGYTGEFVDDNFITAEDIGYEYDDVLDEHYVEAIRLYFEAPDLMKEKYPHTAALLRKAVRENPSLRKLIRFNAIPVLVLGSIAALDQFGRKDLQDMGATPPPDPEDEE